METKLYNTCYILKDILNIIYAIVWMFVSTQGSYIEILTLSVMVLKGGAFERCLGHVGGVLMNRISSHKGDPPKQLLSSLAPCEDTVRS